jgi:hypothetical protein
VAGRRGAVVGRLPKPRRAVAGRAARQFFALTYRHLRWGLSDMARRLDKQPQDEREAFDLVRMQGTSPSEATEPTRLKMNADEPSVGPPLGRPNNLLAANRPHCGCEEWEVESP